MKNTDDVAILRFERTEFGKAVRKKYEHGLAYYRRNDMRCLSPRHDDLCNTISTVLKDNLLIEHKKRGTYN